MSKALSLFDSPFLLGFDQFERALERAARGAADGYPPYNIEQLGETTLRITLAVAGFTLDDLSVHLEQNQLVIRGKKQAAEDENRLFLHRGIATRQFQRSFVLSEDIEVAGAALDNGLLHVDLRRIIPETVVQTIPIRRADGRSPAGDTIHVTNSKDVRKKNEKQPS